MCINILYPRFKNNLSTIHSTFVTAVTSSPKQNSPVLSYHQRNIEEPIIA